MLERPFGRGRGGDADALTARRIVPGHEVEQETVTVLDDPRRPRVAEVEASPRGERRHGVADPLPRDQVGGSDDGDVGGAGVGRVGVVNVADPDDVRVGEVVGVDRIGVGLAGGRIGCRVERCRCRRGRGNSCGDEQGTSRRDAAVHPFNPAVEMLRTTNRWAKTNKSSTGTVRTSAPAISLP